MRSIYLFFVVLSAQAQFMNIRHFLGHLVGKVAICCSLLLLANCANRGSGPQGGPKDTLPPIVTQCNPANGATGVTSKIIEIEFDEFVIVQNPINNITISPPQKQFPNFKTVGKKIRVTFEDSLRANTTYTIDFGSSIVDNNESNPLKGYIYTFSTGNSIDTLTISGKVVDARTLDPKEKIMVGIYSDLADSAFIQQPFDRIAKTNKEGQFTITNVASGQYRLYALNDLSNTYYYMPTGAEIAFHDSIISPTAEDQQQYLLKTFIENPDCKQLLKKYNRLSDKSFQVVMNCPIDEMPTYRLAGDSLPTSSRLLQEPMQRPDSLIYWITDSALYQKDTLLVLIDYQRHDSIMQLEHTTDTLRLIERKKGASRHKKNEDKAPVLAITHNLSKALEVYDTLQLSFNEPIKSFCKDSIHLFQRIDSLEVPVDFLVLFNDSLCARKAYIPFRKEFGSNYQLRIDSAAFVSHYGTTNQSFNKPFSIRSLEEYGNLYIQFPNVPENGIVELLNDGGKIKGSSPIINGEAYFEDVAPGSYTLRLYIDANNNKKWDTGNLLQHIQPEQAFKFPNKIQIRANWDVEETWDYLR